MINQISTVTAQSMSSLEIAQLTGKQHKNVLTDIRKMLNELELRTADFSAVYKNQQDKNMPCFNLPKRETMILVSGYNIKMRAAIIDRWQELENQQPKMPQTFGEALQLCADQQLEIEKKQAQIEAQSQQIEADKPKVAFANILVSDNPRLSMNQFAKNLTKEGGVKIGQNKMMEFLRDQSYLMSGRDKSERNLPYQKYMDLEWFEVEYVQTHNGLSIPQTFITIVGQRMLGNQIIKQFQR